MILLKPQNAGVFELSAIALTALSKFIIMDWLGMRAFYIIGTCLFWIWYVYFRYSHDPAIMRYWGFSRLNFRESWYILLPFLVISIVLTALYARNNDIRLFNIQIVPVLVLYPIWGIIQQFIFLGIIALNLQQIRYFSQNRALLIVLVAFVFSLIHYPYLSLIGFTFLMEIIFLIVFLKWRNLWAIGLAHGWVATFLLYYVLGRELWTELFAWF
jgi:hypothetical protein